MNRKGIAMQERKRQHKNRYKRRKRRINRSILIYSGIVITLAGLFHVATDKFILSTEKQQILNSINISDIEQEQNIKNSDKEIDVKNLYSSYAILIDLTDNKILGEHNSQERMYPASLTKIMTAIIAIENTNNLEEVITLPIDIFEKLYSENASMAGFQPGEQVKLKDLVYAILLPSGAESCMAFADRISGSEEAFVELMNQKAKELGMKNTHFSNSTGLHEVDHYSTVEDMAILLSYALQNESFRSAFTSSRYSTQSTAQHPVGLTLHSTMFKYMDSTEVTGGEIIGGKTGYTDEAGLCLASLANIGGKEYILVTAKANGTPYTKKFHILDAIDIYNQIGEMEEFTDMAS